MNEELIRISDKAFSEEDSTENVIPPQDIFAFNESRSCADLKRMYDKEQIDIKPDFQREKVWSQPAKTRFLDSLLKNLPIPSMCVSLDVKTNKRIVIDGLQRISTIVEFLGAIADKDTDYVLARLDDVDERLSGKSAKEISENYLEVISAIENVSIPVTTLRCNSEKENHMEYIFTIFHRLNTGGIKLNNQEIRNCIFSGSFNQLLFDCSHENKEFLDGFLTKNSRYSHEEFILRFFAFHDNYLNYSGILATFLNKYMDENRRISENDVSIKKDLFSRVIRITSLAIGKNKVSKIVLESIMYGIGKNIGFLEKEMDSSLLEKRFNSLLELDAFKSEELQSGLLQVQKVKSRFNASLNSFGPNKVF